MDTVFVEGGRGYHLSPADSAVLITPVFTLGIRHSFYSDAFVQLRADMWSTNHGRDIWIGPSVGYRHNTESGQFFTEGSLGYGYLTKPDGQYSDGALTTKQQFEITMGVGYYTNKNSEIGLGVAHLSNCAKICNRNESFSPNPGKNWLRVSYGIHY